MLEASSFNYELQITNYDKLKKTKTNVMLEASSLIKTNFARGKRSITLIFPNLLKMLRASA